MARFTVDEQTELVRLSTEHADELFRLIDVHREWLSQWFAWPAGVGSPADSLTYIRRLTTQWKDDEAVGYGLFIDGHLMGVLELSGLNSDNRCGRLGFWLAPAAGGRGRMTRACELLTGWAFEQAGLNRLEIRTVVDNARGRAVPERLGCRLEGVARQAKRLGSRYADVAVYAMLASQWFEMKQLARHIGY
jgi:Acetyltransferases, including N-acetylases of ribosomal proteins